MAHDEGLAQRIRELLQDDPRISEKKMFGGVAFFASGKMAAGIIRSELMVHVGPDAHDEAASLPHARAMDFTRRPMRGFVQIAPAGFEEDADLRAWLARGIAYAEAPSRKAPRAKAAARSPASSKAAPATKPKRRSSAPGPRR